MEIWILIILVIGAVILLSGCKKPVIPNPPGPEPEPPEPEPEPLPDPVYYKWQLVDETTERWAKYIEGMKNVTKDSLLALELMKKVDGVKFYVWTAEQGDYWETPDEVYEKGKVDCDGFARLTADALGRFVKLPEVHWLEYYGYYRYYFLKDDKWQYELKLGGHAITVYPKDGELLAFSNTNWWWNNNFGTDYVSVGEMTFPEGIVLIRCRHWLTGKLEWIMEAKDNEILEGSCIFDRDKKAVV